MPDLLAVHHTSGLLIQLLLTLRHTHARTHTHLRVICRQIEVVPPQEVRLIVDALHSQLCGWKGACGVVGGWKMIATRSNFG